MRLRIVGSGDAFNAAGRAHACSWLEGLADRPFMVDFGATALMQLQAMSLDHRDLGGIAITHLHGDHIGGLPYLWIDMLFRRKRQEPVEILGPPGVEERVMALVGTAYGSAASEELPCEVVWTEIAPGETRSWLGTTVSAWDARHQDPPEISLGFSISSPRGRAAFSGDSIMSEDLLRGLRGAQLAVVECTDVEPPAGAHCTWKEWEALLPSLDVGTLVLTHLGDAMRERASDLRHARDGSPRLVFADDGLLIQAMDGGGSPT